MTNGDYSKFWRLKGPEPLVIAGKAAISDFKAEDGAILFVELGPGVEVTLPARVSLRRVSTAGAPVFEVISNVPVRVEGARIEMSRDGVTWTPVDGALPVNRPGSTLCIRGIR